MIERTLELIELTYCLIIASMYTDLWVFEPLYVKVVQYSVDFWNTHICGRICPHILIQIYFSSNSGGFSVLISKEKLGSSLCLTHHHTLTLRPSLFELSMTRMLLEYTFDIKFFLCFVTIGPHWRFQLCIPGEYTYSG